MSIIKNAKNFNPSFTQAELINYLKNLVSQEKPITFFIGDMYEITFENVTNIRTQANLDQSEYAFSVHFYSNDLNVGKVNIPKDKIYTILDLGYPKIEVIEGIDRDTNKIIRVH